MFTGAKRAGDADDAIKHAAFDSLQAVQSVVLLVGGGPLTFKSFSSAVENGTPVVVRHL